MIEATIFYVFGALLLGAGIGVITSRNMVHSALFLVLKRTTLGLQVRAVSQNRSMARAMGVPADVLEVSVEQAKRQREGG